MAGEFFNIADALKVVYPPKAVDAMVNAEAPFRDQLDSKIPAGARPSEGVVKFGGNLNPPQNNASIADGGTLPAPKDRTQVQFTLYPAVLTGGLTISWGTKDAFNSNKSAFNGGELRRKVQESAEDLGKFIEQTYVGTHGTGRRARVESDGASSTFVAALPEGVKLLRENQYISFRTADGGNTITIDAGTEVTNGLRFITAINRATRTVTYSGPDATTTSAHIHPVAEVNQVFRTDPGATFPNGLRGLVDDGTFATSIHGLDRVTTYPKLKANVSSNGGVLRNLTEQILIRACHENREVSGKRVTDCWTGPGQYEKYIEFVAADRKYMVGGDELQGMKTGYKKLVHATPQGDITLQLSFDIIPRELYLLNWGTFFHYTARELDWWDGDMLKPTPTSGGYKASFLAYLRATENIGCDMPIANTVIRDLTDPSIGDS